MTQRGNGRSALVWLGAAVTACGGWVDLESPETGSGGTAAGTVGAVAGTKAANGGTAGSSGTGHGQAGTPHSEPVVGGVGGEFVGEGGSDIGPEPLPLSVLEPPAPHLLPTGADGPGITFSASTVIDAGSLERGVLVGATEYCFKKPQSQFTCDFQSREPFVWTEVAGMVPLDRLNAGGLSFFSNLVSDDGNTVVGAFNGESDFGGFFRWTKAAGATSLGEPAGTASGQPFAMSSDGKVVVGLAKVGDKGKDIVHSQFLWSEQGGYLSLGDNATWPADGEVVGVTADGLTVFGQTTFASATHAAFRWTLEGGTQLLPGLPGLSYCRIDRSTPDGAALFGTCTDVQQVGHAFRWTEAGGTESLSNTSDGCALKGIFSVSSDGDAAFGSVACDDDIYAPGRWSADGGVSKLPAAPTSFHTELSLTGSGNGSAAFGLLLPGAEPGLPVGEGAAGSQAFRWTAAMGLVPLPPSNGQNFTAASATDAQGLVIVGRSGVANSTSRAVLWDASGPLDIASYVSSHGVDLQGLELTHSERVAVSGDTILVQGFAQAQNRGGVWFARIPVQH